MAGILAKEITLKYDSIVASGSQTYGNSVVNVQEIPDLGNNVPEQIDITCVGDSEHKYMEGLQDNTQDLQFKLLHDSTQYATLSAITSTQAWQISFPDGMGATDTATFTGKPYIKMAGISVGGAMMDTLTINVNSKIVFA